MKEAFYDDLLSLTTTIPSTEALFICGDLNGHIGAAASGFEGVHGGQAFGTRNVEGDRILEIATACELVVANSFYKKRESHLINSDSSWQCFKKALKTLLKQSVACQRTTSGAKKPGAGMINWMLKNTIFKSCWEI